MVRKQGADMRYENIITIEPGKRSGKPCIRGMRITVSDVLEYLASGMFEDEILADFSELTRDDIKSCLAFAAIANASSFTTRREASPRPSDRMVSQIQDLYPGSSHVKAHQLIHTDDVRIWSFASDHGYAIASKDSDFRQRSFLFGHPPKLVFLRVGNCPTSSHSQSTSFQRRASPGVRYRSERQHLNPGLTPINPHWHGETSAAAKDLSKGRRIRDVESTDWPTPVDANKPSQWSGQTTAIGSALCFNLLMQASPACNSP